MASQERPEDLTGLTAPVTLIRNSGKEAGSRLTVPAGGDFVRRLLFHAQDKVAPGDEVHCELFDQPRIIGLVDPVVLKSGLSHWIADIFTRSEWLETPRNYYPRCKYHWYKVSQIANDPDADAALGPGWADTPAAFGPYLDSRPQHLAGHDPTYWVDHWLVEGISSESKQIKAQLLRADSFFWKAPDASFDEAMQRAFDGIAGVLASGKILTEEILGFDLPDLVWDSAIKAGWWRLFSDTPSRIFPEQIGHYWVWRDDRKDWELLFHPHIARWRAHLLEASVEVERSARIADPPGKPAAQPASGGPINDDAARAEAVTQARGVVALEAEGAQVSKRSMSRRKPDLATSKERLELCDTLGEELATLKPELKRYCTVEGLKGKHPAFALWEMITDAELLDLVNGEDFAPRAYAENLVLRKYGLTSRETLKKDRRKLGKAGRNSRPTRTHL